MCVSVFVYLCVHLFVPTFVCVWVCVSVCAHTYSTSSAHSIHKISNYMKFGIKKGITDLSY